MTTPKNIIGKTAKCILKEGSTEKQLDKSLPVCASVKDEIHVNLTNAQVSNDTVSLVDGKLVRRIIISGVSTGENFNNGERDRYKLLIMEKFNNLNFPTSDQVSIVFNPAFASSPNVTITLSFDVKCGNATKENACTYVNGEWKQNTRFTFNNNLKMSQQQFNANCANQLVNCDLQQSCELGSLKTISTCSDANNEVYEADIVKKHNTNNPLSKSCVDAFGERLPLGYNPADIKTETNKMTYYKTCGIDNKFEELCTKEGQFKLLKKVIREQCKPPNNSECKSQVCLEFSPDFKSKLNVSYRPNPTNPSTGTKTITVDIVEGNSAYLSTPEFRQFVADSIGVNDSATIDLQGRRLIITINYNCGSLDKTYENNGECLYENNNWIKRYEQSYKNSENIDTAAMDQQCKITNKRVTEECDQAISCEIQQDTSVSNTCENGEQRIVYNIVKKNSKSGNDCLSMARARNATYNFILDGNKVLGNKACSVTPTPTTQNVDCQVSDWGDCTKTCGGGTRTRQVTVDKKGNGRSCPSLSESCNTQACPTQDTTPTTQNVDCEVSDWGDCTKTCGGGTRTRQVIVTKQGNGRSCPPLSESCNTQACPTQDTTPSPSTQNVDCEVSDWGDCTKTCGSGTRTRQVIVTKQGNGRSCPSLSESCNTQACPTEDKKKDAPADKSNMIMILAIVFMFLIMIGLGLFLVLRKK
jgi:hypothetical protein